MECFVNLHGETIRPHRTGDRAECPCCGGGLIAACGEILAHHWKHESGKDCDAWSEAKSDWHLSWQAFLEERYKARCEVWIKRGRVMHRADAVLPDGTVVEIQHSSISPQEIRARELFYGKMAWIFDAQEAGRRDRLRFFDGKYWNVVWKHPRKTLIAARRQIYLDTGFIMSPRDGCECDAFLSPPPSCEVWAVEKFKFYDQTRFYARCDFIDPWRMFNHNPGRY